MKIQIASDLHLETWRDTKLDEQAFKPAKDRDLLILAGDIGVGIGALQFIMGELQHSPVVYVAGNHEHYGLTMHGEVEETWTSIANDTPGLHFLNGKAVTIDEVRFYGCTWYSNLWGATGRKTQTAISRYITDFRPPRDDCGRWTVDRHVETHERETQAMREHAGEVDVVVTHWPPTLKAMHSKYAKARGTEAFLNRYFINDEDDLLREMDAKFWISGHTHEPHEATVGRTTSVGNPTGYRGEKRGEGFAPDRVIEI